MYIFLIRNSLEKGSLPFIFKKRKLLKFKLPKSQIRFKRVKELASIIFLIRNCSEKPIHLLCFTLVVSYQLFFFMKQIRACTKTIRNNRKTF